MIIDRGLDWQGKSFSISLLLLIILIQFYSIN